MPWSYFYTAGREPIIFIMGMFILFILIIISSMLINICKDNKIKRAFYFALLLQIIILIIDNYVIDFPLINLDARAHEGLAWYSYENNINIGRGEYNTFILNPIYKLLGIRVAIIFGAINVVCHILISLNLYKIFNILKIEKNLERFLMYILILSPISLIFRAGILREAIMIMFITYSLKNFVIYTKYKNGGAIIKTFLFLILGAVFHNGMIFLAVGYLLYLLDGGKKKKGAQIIIFLLAIGIFIILKDKLLEKVGGGDIDKILAFNNEGSLKLAGSAYLQSVTTTSLGGILIYLPLFMFYFLYSPTPEMIRGVLDIATFLLNSSIYIYITIIGIKSYKKIKNNLSKKEKKIINVLLFSSLFTIVVFSIGTRNAGTAMRHRDKILPFLIVIFAIIRNKYFIELKYRKIRRREIGRDLNETN